MGFISLASLMDKGTPVILLALLIISIVNTVFVRVLSTTVKGIKDNTIWKDTYKSDQRTVVVQLNALDERIKRLENKRNGGT